MNELRTDLTRRITDVVGAGRSAAVADLASYAIDGVTPGAVAFPDCVEQVSQLLAFANTNELSVVPRGGATAMARGSLPRSVDIVVCLERLNKVLDYSPEDMTIAVQAGVTLDQMQSLMAEKGQMLPLDPPLPGQATAGGMLATNASGPLRYQFGMPRDFALGTVVVYADGTVAKAGGRTVKNVAGYDMTRLHIGALGTLGIIVEATFKVTPRPKSLVTVSGTFATLAEAAAAARALRMARIVPWSLVLLGPGAVPDQTAAFTVAVRLGGQPVVVGPQTQRAMDTLRESGGASVGEVADAEASFWPVVRDWPATAASASSVMVRMGIAPSHLRDVMASSLGIAARHGLAAVTLAHPGAATVYCSLVGDDTALNNAVNGMVAAVKEWNGNLSLEHCPVGLKAHLPVWGGAGADDLTQRVKKTFDPKCILNPGRFVGGI
jgi:glycolate oxidase FAD binding subunit